MSRVSATLVWVCGGDVIEDRVNENMAKENGLDMRIRGRRPPNSCLKPN